MKRISFFVYLLLFFPLLMIAQTQKDFVISIQPIIVQDNNGNDPASFNIPMDLVKGVFKNTDIDLYFFEPIYYNNIKARDGMINLDSIVNLAYRDGIIRGNGEIANMFFVNAVDGKKGPLGRGMMNGHLTFIALGKKNKKMQTFVIAHELCHNLGLPHVVDDENIPNDIPNIMGDGPFRKRINPEYSLTPYQIKCLKKSKLVRPGIELLSKEEGEKAILDESFEPFFSGLQKLETAAFLAQEIEYQDSEEIQDFARKKFSEAVMEFSSKEEEALQFIIQQINNTLNENGLHTFAAHPWRIIKTKSWLCGGFAYTRSNNIILSEKHMQFISENYKANMNSTEIQKLMERMGALLVHEQTHCLQRTFPSKFEKLYTDGWNFKKVSIESPASIKKLQVSNPDAPIANWLIPSKRNEYYWIRTLFKEKKNQPVMGKDFTEHVYIVEEKDDQYSLKRGKAGSPLYMHLKDISSFTETFPVSRGIDHPNEISAYMMADLFTSILRNEHPFMESSKSTTKNIKQFKRWLTKF